MISFNWIDYLITGLVIVDVIAFLFMIRKFIGQLSIAYLKLFVLNAIVILFLQQTGLDHLRQESVFIRAGKVIQEIGRLAYEIRK